jgi:hypothetical protein
LRRQHYLELFSQISLRELRKPSRLRQHDRFDAPDARREGV